MYEVCISNRLGVTHEYDRQTDRRSHSKGRAAALYYVARPKTTSNCETVWSLQTLNH